MAAHLLLDIPVRLFQEPPTKLQSQNHAKIDQTVSEDCLLFKFSLAYHNLLFIGHFGVQAKLKKTLGTCRILKIENVFLYETISLHIKQLN